ncbi:DUF4251 domain-containing protein [Winogradskyella ursingii]|uniref:DUF4251 domain-containing protein n=1 Tax=Winogradskyella ursingii TaxID=2686079 RepID=UPI0015CC8225|nr:DUF4251 domain-containing protein [Winogradskyella ursingii]
MKRTSFTISILFCLLLLNCGASKENISESDRAAFNDLKTSILTSPIRFEAESASPTQTFGFVAASNYLLRQTGSVSSRIYLNDRNDYMYISKDSVNSELSYYGELRNPTYGSINNGKIELEGSPRKLKIEENDKKQNITLNFRATNDSEECEVTMILFPNRKATVIINSLNRTTIRYNGVFSIVEKIEN